MSGTNNIPFLDLVTPHADLKEELCEVFNKTLDTAGFIGGPMVLGFGEDFAKFCEVGHCVGVGSGTDALRFALIAAGVGSGDAVITVPNMFIATTEAISPGEPVEYPFYFQMTMSAMEKGRYTGVFPASRWMA